MKPVAEVKAGVAFLVVAMPEGFLALQFLCDLLMRYILRFELDAPCDPVLPHGERLLYVVIPGDEQPHQDVIIAVEVLARKVYASEDREFRVG